MIELRVRTALLLAILLLGLALRLAPWGQNRFLEDEALYAYWGLQIATGADPMLDYEPVDKPPLYPYTLALSFLLAPPRPGGIEAGDEATARLPSLLASVAGIALLYALGREIYRDERVGLLAALLLAVSPFDILFASTAFTDPLLVAWVLAALLAAVRGRLGLAGLLAGLAVATKQQGLVFLPLVVAVGLMARPKFRAPGHFQGTNVAPERPKQSSLGSRLRIPGWLRFGLGFAAIAGGALGWDAARLQRPGFFQQGLLSYGGLGPAQPQALADRALAWLRLAGYFWASPWFNALLIAALAIWLLGRLLGRIREPDSGHSQGRSKDRSPRSPRGSHFDVLLAAFVAGFLLLHWLIGFQVWDRYLLGLVPLLAMLAARAFLGLGQAFRAVRWRRAYACGLAAVVVVSLSGPLVQAARSELPVGGDHGAYDGIDELAAYMRTKAPAGAVLYHYWLGYHYRFYLYGAPLRLHWYPDLEDLAHDATVYRREPRYIAFPGWRDDGPARAALAGAGVHLVPVLDTVRRDGTVSFRLYRLEGP